MNAKIRSNQPIDWPWVGFMSWLDLLFAHWPIDPAAMRDRIPPQLTLETFDGSSWVGVVPFIMSNTRPRLSPLAMSNFPELNVRTYVSHRGTSGIYFFSLDAASRLLVWGARTFASLPYYNAAMRCETDAQGWTPYESVRAAHRRAAPAQWRGRYRPTGPPSPAKPGTLDHFLTERYCLFSVTPRGTVLRLDVAHPPWPLQTAEAEVQTDTMLDPIGLMRPDIPPLLHFARRQDVRAWWPVRADGSPR